MVVEGRVSNARYFIMQKENPYLKFIKEDGSIDHTIIEEIKDVRAGTKQVDQELQKSLLERETYILDLYNQGYTLDFIGKQLGLSRERIRQIVGPTICAARKKEKEELYKTEALIKEVFKILNLFAYWSKHSAGRYKTGKCRCDICRKANNDMCRDYHRKNPKYKLVQYAWQKNNLDKVQITRQRWRDKYKIRLANGEAKHGLVAYNICQCRCDICKDAAKIEGAKKTAKRRANKIK